MEAFCVKCKAKRTMKGEVKTTVNGHSAVKGSCPKCGTHMFRFVSSKAK